MTHPAQTTLILQHQLLPCCLRLSSSLQHTPNSHVLHAPLAGKKQTQSSRAPILLWVPPVGKQRPAKGNFLCKSISPTGTDFLFLFLKCKLGKLGRTSVFTGMKAQKATTMPTWCKHTVRKWPLHCCPVALSMHEVINLSPPSLKFLESSTCSCLSSSAPVRSFANTFALQNHIQSMTDPTQQKPVVCATFSGTSWGHVNCGPKYLKHKLNKKCSRYSWQDSPQIAGKGQN